MELLSREQAIVQGSRLYFTGAPCKHGHIAPRRLTTSLSGGVCVECKRTYRTSDSAKGTSRRNYAKNPLRVVENARRWDMLNRELKASYSRAWKKENKEIVRASDAKRRAAVYAALCSCCTSRMFADFFATASLVGYHVDHIVPLADGGAHCIQNLQMLPPDVHARKTAAENSRRTRRLH